MVHRRIKALGLLTLGVLVSCAGCAPLESGTPWRIGSAETDFDRSHKVKFEGILRDHLGTPLTGVVSVLFAIYEQPRDGASLWQEVQNIELDDRGHFTAFVGSTRSEGIPTYLFTTEKTRWLGMQIMQPGEVERPRIQLISAPQGLMTARVLGFANPAGSGDQSTIPPQSGDQPASTSTESQGGSGETADSQESGTKPDPTNQTGETDQGRSGWRRTHRPETQ